MRDRALGGGKDGWKHGQGETLRRQKEKEKERGEIGSAVMARVSWQSNSCRSVAQGALIDRQPLKS